VGNGANGKSVLLKVLAGLLGPSMVAAVQPSQFGNKFQRAYLHGKLANIVTEVPEGAEIPDAELKAITSGEATTVEHKNGHPFDIHPYATCWFGTNHMPRTRDFSDAMFRRAVVLKFNRTLAEAERDPYLADWLIGKELPGILAMGLRAVAGALRRAELRQGDITIPPSARDAVREWRFNSDQVEQFAEECCYVASGASITSADLYRAYEAWARDAGIKHTLGRKAFTERVVRLGGEAGKAGKENTRMIFGIALRGGYGGFGGLRAA
jgi:putative DNA primase/helicase